MLPRQRGVVGGASLNTSIKTRIETGSVAREVPERSHPLSTLPLKQGLKLRSENANYSQWDLSQHFH